MNVNEVNDDLIGKRCKCLFLGKMVTGTIVKIKRNKHCVQVKVRFDVTQYFDQERYTSEWVIGWFDGFKSGKLKHLELINIQYKNISKNNNYISNKIFKAKYSRKKNIDLDIKVI